MAADATFALTAFLNAGYQEEAAAGATGCCGLRPGCRSGCARCTAATAPATPCRMTCPGCRAGKSRPGHIGNPAADQFQLDIYGEVLDSLHLCEQAGLDGRPWEIAIETELVAHIEKVWENPDQGIWESRGPARHFTHSKVMAWVGVDRYLKLKDIAAPRRRGSKACASGCTDDCRDGFDAARNSFVQTFDGPRVLDASLLMLPLVGFLPIDDPRIAGTIAAIEGELVEDGLVRRWPRATPDEGAFIACTCWLADCLAMQGRKREARAYLERVIGLPTMSGCCRRSGTRGRRMLGNFPQALSHLALINTALGLCGPVLQRGGG